MGAEEQVLTQGLRTHVEQLAGEIGERNISRPQALQAAASYIGLSSLLAVGNHGRGGVKELAPGGDNKKLSKSGD